MRSKGRKLALLTCDEHRTETSSDVVVHADNPDSSEESRERKVTRDDDRVELEKARSARARAEKAEADSEEGASGVVQSSHEVDD